VLCLGGQNINLDVCVCVQGVLSITWLRLAKQVQMRNCSLTYGSATAGDVHHVVDNRACFPPSHSNPTLIPSHPSTCSLRVWMYATN
jgi:hypothetical protein